MGSTRLTMIQSIHYSRSVRIIELSIFASGGSTWSGSRHAAYRRAWAGQPWRRFPCLAAWFCYEKRHDGSLDGWGWSPCPKAGKTLGARAFCALMSLLIVSFFHSPCLIRKLQCAALLNGGGVISLTPTNDILSVT